MAYKTSFSAVELWALWGFRNGCIRFYICPNRISIHQFNFWALGLSGGGELSNEDVASTVHTSNATSKNLVWAILSKLTMNKRHTSAGTVTIHHLFQLWKQWYKVTKVYLPIKAITAELDINVEIAYSIIHDFWTQEDAMSTQSEANISPSWQYKSRPIHVPIM